MCPICHKNHKKRCQKKCSFCNKPYKRKDHLEDHVLKCHVKLYILASEKPLDLSTPKKVAKAPGFPSPKNAQDSTGNTIGHCNVLDLSNENNNIDQSVGTSSIGLITPNPSNVSCHEAKSNQLENPCCVNFSMEDVSDSNFQDKRPSKEGDSVAIQSCKKKPLCCYGCCSFLFTKWRRRCWVQF